MHLLGSEAFRFLVCVDAALDADQRAAAIKAVSDRLREILARKRMDNVRYDVLAVDDLPINPRTRKFQLIVDQRSLQ
jgi:hypothetical protein